MLFDCAFANVQPHSGSQANQAVFFALLKPGDTFMGMALAAGGHLTHGTSSTFRANGFTPSHYGVRARDPRIDYDEVEASPRPSGPSSSSPAARPIRAIIDFAASADRDESAPISWSTWRISPVWSPAALFPSPLPHAHVVTTTTHKTLRGPRGGMILANDEEIGKKINSAVFPACRAGR